MVRTQPISLLKLFLLYVSRTYLVAKGRDCGDGAISFMHQFHMPDARLPVECPGLPEPGGQGSHCLQILADQLVTLFQTVCVWGGADYADHITTRPSDFYSFLRPCWMCCCCPCTTNWPHSQSQSLKKPSVVLTDFYTTHNFYKRRVSNINTRSFRIF